MHDSTLADDSLAAKSIAEEHFWRDYLANVMTTTRIGGSHRASLSTNGFAAVTATWESPRRGDGGDLACIAYAAWARLLATYAGDSDVVFGINGDRPLRVRVDPAQDAAAFLAAVAKGVVQVSGHASTPLSRLHELANLDAATPLFDTVVYFGDAAHVQTNEANASVVVSISQAQPPTLSLRYRDGLISTGLASEMLEQFRMLCEVLPAQPDSLLHALPVVSGRYATRALAEWNDTAETFDEVVTLHGLVERQAATHPERLAVVGDDGELTYGELDKRANQLARHLIGIGVKPGDQVGLCTEKSAATVVGMLGIMKAGAAYVPIDPGYPSSRIEYMAEDARLSALLTWGKAAAAVAGLALARVALDDDWAAVARHSSDALPFRVPADAFAYAIYTSGSTGQPKCVLLNHRGRVNNIEDYCRRLALTEVDRVLCVSSLSFDISVCNIFCMFRAGGCIVFPSLDRLKDPDHWLDVMHERSVTFWHSAPALMDALLDAASERDYDRDTLRVALLGGDWIPLGQPARARAAFPSLWFVTAGGATELSIDSVFYPVDTVDPAWVSIPYGKPLANQSALILDAHFQIAPIGVPGELHLGGVGIGAGYMNRPALTAQKFIAHPWPSFPGERLYRTGDLAKYGPDGTVELLGRIDFQVKIRGMRIELGEIEAVLGEHPQIEACLAGAPLDVMGDRRLVAYVVPSPDACLEADTDREAWQAQLQDWLRQRVPSHLLPEAFIRLDRLPLTPNGKVDRRHLPVPDSQAYTARAYEPPRNDIERELAALWRSLLGIERVGRHDHFFQLGGHSLRAVLMLSRLRRQFGVDLPQSTLFEHPTLAELAQAIVESVADHQGVDAGGNIEPASRQGRLPLSFAQQRLWFLGQLDELDAAYHMPAAWRLRGALNVAALRTALDRLFARHESLRSRFPSIDGEPYVELLPADHGLPCSEHDLRSDSAPERQLDMRLRDEAHARFDLATGPLIRARLFRLAEHDHVLSLTQHHIVSDGWSTAHLIGELQALYAAFDKGEPDPLAPLGIQYPDYAVWQRNWLVGERQRLQADYWRTALAVAPTVLALPTDRPRPRRFNSKGGTQPIVLDAELTRQIRRVARQQGVTVFMLLMAAWSAVLARLSRQDDLMVGAVTASRNRAEIETLIGFFVNTVALRMDLSGEPSVRELLARVRHVALRAQDHQDLPFEQVVDIAQAPRHASHAPLCQVVFAWQSYEEGELALDGLDVDLLPVPFERVRFDLELSLHEAGERIVGDLAYACALFDPATVERHTAYLEQMLRAIVADIEQPVSAIALIDDAERQRLLHEWNRTAAPYPHDRCVQHLFEDQVRRTPDAVALIEQEHTLSYTQLNIQANRLAHRLIALGVRAGDSVALLLDRSAALVIAELAVLKAGGTYVPIDRQIPPSRQAWVVEDSRACVLVTDRVTDVPSSLTVPVLDLGTLIGETLHETDPVVAMGSDAIAYVMYTSGSTGTPKGVLTPHRAIARLLFANRYADFDASDCVAFAANPAFDAGTMEVWGALLHGGRLAILDGDTVLDAARLDRALERYGVTALFLTTALFNLYAQAIPKALARLKYLLCGGERNDPAAFWRVLAEGGPQHLIHCYGPTETTTYALTCEITPAWRGHDNLPMGRPIGNTRAYLLDAHRQPVPLGAVGEIYIGGDGVALGYLHRPELTAERFLPDPFVEAADARMYRTGDLARYLPDGNLVFIGRVDHQVKIRGYRIEPGEIEARLVDHPWIRDAAVLVRQDGGNKRLVAYVVADAESTDELAVVLRTHLATLLPEYMIPAAFMALPAFPLTPNGKLDRKALPAPDDSAFGLRGYEPPEGDTETLLATLWQELLGVGRVGRHDHFFELGGHSLVAVRLLSRIEQSLGAPWSLSTLFAHPSLHAMAAALQRDMSQQASRPAMSIAPIVPIARTLDLPLSFAQQRLWFLSQLEDVSATYHIPFGVRLHGTLDASALRHSLDRLFDRHEALRSVFVTVGGEPRARLLAPGDGVPWTQHDLRQSPDPDKTLARLMEEEARAPFDLTLGPLLRACLVRLGDDDHVLLLTQHHIVSDGWSLGVQMRELGALYAAFARAQADPLPPLTIQYPDYAAWQRDWLSGERLRDHANYWRRALSESPVLLTVPTDRPRPPRQSFDGAELPIRLDAALTEQLKRLSRQHDCTLFMTVLAAWSIVLSRLSGQQDLVIGTPVAHRSRQEIEPLIGFFVNTLAMRIDLSGEPTTTDLLGRVKQRVLDAQSHQDLPFEQVVEIAKPPRRLEHAPLFQVLFAWHSHDDLSAALPGLHAQVLPLPVHTVNVDLELSLGERDGRIEGGLSYATALFDLGTAERYTDYLVRVLRAMAENANDVVERIDMLGSAEREYLLDAVNHTDVDYPRTTCIHQLFEQQAASRPHATALIFESQRWSYAQLNAQANRLAHRCIELGVRPGERVGLCVARGPYMVVGLLAILKAGGAYVPLDPAYPSDRLAHVLDDASPVLVICDGAGSDALKTSALSRRPVLDLRAWQEEGVDPTSGDSDPIVPGLSSSDLAYVIYTSGSTGRPKGVMVEHRTVVNFLCAMSDAPGLAATDRLLAVTSMSFDIAGLEIYLPLSNGAQLVLASRDEVADPTRLRRLLHAQQITVMQATPAGWRALLDASGEEPPAGLRAWCGGEALSTALAANLCERFDEVWNLYGPTETTIWSTAGRVRVPASASSANLGIGRPIANTKIYLLDAHGAPVPRGAVGELYIGGEGVARGYHHLAEQTATRFVRDPFHASMGARMYRTGDLARYLPDGDLEFLGRNDHQIKVRGYRIEPGEIEVRLREHPAVRDAVVVVRNDRDDPRLVAYILGRDGIALDEPATVLKSHLARTLPAYMLPGAFVALQAWPLTPNGKLDRAALPAPDDDAVERSAYVAPQGETETLLADIWSELLGIESVGRHDDFFDLGGHSLLAVQMLGRIETELGLRLEHSSIFRFPVLEQLSRHVLLAVLAQEFDPDQLNELAFANESAP
ncbi:non-ribosomal peptide synthetase [Dyella sp. GSA-30]|uniref:non-ribosomal peptide synthetase n=1 Tax=Dyella sp. GSA-30 TaxID=2994496 RepID=UPI0024921F54|nr:non-ribosomal peptide synthetase [Dyella sp. GSA-30]BDU21546.1 hypothetical protein DYGSA30_30030 [Dyella sp. GSA-30]